MNIKGKGQRLIPEELLKYLEAYKEAHPDPTQGGGATLDDIVDSQNHKRFIEGSGTPETITGMTVDYNKWSLSGTHLMLVMAGTFENNVNALTELINYTLPEWVRDKIVSIGPNGEINRYNPIYYYIGGTTYSRTALLKKTASGLSITQGNNIDVTSGKVFFRIQFDLLIDAS